MQKFLLAFYGIVFIVLGCIAALWIVKILKNAFGYRESDEDTDE